MCLWVGGYVWVGSEMCLWIGGCVWVASLLGLGFLSGLDDGLGRLWGVSSACGGSVGPTRGSMSSSSKGKHLSRSKNSDLAQSCKK